MAVTDKMMHAHGKTAIKYVDATVNAVISQTALVVYSLTPNYPYQVERITSFCSATAGTVTADVQIAGTTTLASAVAFTAATEVLGTLTTTTANLTGKSGQALTVLYTSNGTGTTTNGSITVAIRPLVAGQGGSAPQP